MRLYPKKNRASPSYATSFLRSARTGIVHDRAAGRGYSGKKQAPPS